MTRKSAILVLMVFTIYFLFVATPVTYGSVPNGTIGNEISNRILSYISTGEVWEVNDDFEIYGNTAVSNSDFYEMVIEGEQKVYLLYRTNRSIDLPYDALLMVKTPSKTYSYEFVEKINTNDSALLVGIKDFVSKYSDIINQEYDHSVSTMSAGNVPTTFINCIVEQEYMRRFDKYGYILYHIAVSLYEVDDTSLLYIVTINNSFTPGQVAKENGETDYGNYRIKSGFVHMTVEQAFDRNEETYYGIRWGNVPYKKDYWPVNLPAVCAVTSSLQAGVTLGYSFENGFSTDGLSLSENHNYGMNISFGYSKTITRTEPALSVQVNSADTAKCEWLFTYKNAAIETYHQQTNYMFEISNSRRDMFIGDFRLKLDYKFGVKKAIGFLQESFYSDDLMVRAGEYQRIYAFCNGLI